MKGDILYITAQLSDPYEGMDDEPARDQGNLEDSGDSGDYNPDTESDEEE
jgi:hypothetical protein